MLLVLHDDAAREYAYGPAKGLPDVKLGGFTQALYDQTKNDGWTVVSMKNDWSQVFAFEEVKQTARQKAAPVTVQSEAEPVGLAVK